MMQNSLTKPFSLKSYLEVTKPRILIMVLVTTTIGFVLASPFFQIDYFILTMTLIGTAFSAAGAGTLNSCVERDFDAKMERTKKRPFPQQKISPAVGITYGLILSLLGIFFLQTFVNMLTSFLSLLTIFLYVVIYTPLKQISWLNTFVGAVPGALPILMGWSAAANNLNLLAWILFLILFCWQHPHFYAIAWMYREDYQKGGFKMLPVIDSSGRRTFVHVIFYTILMLGFSLLPGIWNLLSVTYLIGASVLGLMVLVASVMFVKKPTKKQAKYLLQASLLYFPLFLSLVIVEKIMTLP